MNEAIKEIYAIIGDIHAVVARNDENKNDIERACRREYGQDEDSFIEQAMNGMVDAQEAMETTSDDLLDIEEMLKMLIEAIEYEQLSVKAQAT